MQHQRSSDQKFLVLLVLLIFLVFGPLAIGLKTLKWDAADLTLPTFSLIRAALWNGEWPLWNPLQNQGWVTGIVPTFWNPVYLVCGGIFADPLRALNAVYLLLLTIAGWGFYKFSGLFFEHKNTAIIAGQLYPLSGFFIAYSQHIGWLEGAAWTPVLLYLSHRCYRDGKRYHLFFLAISFYLFSTAAYPGYVLTITYFLIFQSGYHFAVSYRNTRNAADSLRLPAMIATATGVLSALTWKCYYEQLSYITRGTGDWVIQSRAGSSLLSDYLSLIFSKSSTIARKK